MAKHRTSGTGDPVSQDGYTLIEILVVVSVVALVSALALTTLPSLSASADLRATSRDIATLLKQARSRALFEDRQVQVVLDREQRTFYVAGMRKVAVGEELRIKFHTAREEFLTESSAGIRFFPDGSSTGGRIVITRNQNKSDIQIINVDWLTGAIEVSASASS